MNLVQIKTWWKNSLAFRHITVVIDRHFQKRLTNKKFTILCSNCIGGVIYHRLGHQFLSPTINMFFTQPDFVSFLLHLDEYLALPLCFISSDPYPVATLGSDNLPEITLNFNHANNLEEATRNWETRKTRINKQNLYIILYKLDGITLDQLHQLDDYPCNNKVVLTSAPLPEISWSFYIKPNPRSQYPSSYLGKNVLGIRDFEKHFDFVGFINKI